MLLNSALMATLLLAARTGVVKADGTTCSSIAEIVDAAGLGQLNTAVAAATPQLLSRPEGALVLGALVQDISLPEGSRVTIFAPNDAAFMEAAEKFGGELPVSAIPDVLLNHVVPQDLTAELLLGILGKLNGAPALFETVLGNTIAITTDGTSIFVQSEGIEAPGAQVILPDQITCAGPIHVIDEVLLPAFPDGTTVEVGSAAVVAPGTATAAVAPSPGPIGSRDFPIDFADYGDYTGDLDYGPIVAEPLVAFGDDVLIAPVQAPMTEAPTVAPVAEPPMVVAPVVAPVGDSPISMLAPVGDEPTAGPVIAPVGDEPMVAPGPGPMATDPMEAEAETPVEGTDRGLAEGELAVEGGSPIIQGEAASAFTASLFSSALAVAAAAMLVVA